MGRTDPHVGARCVLSLPYDDLTDPVRLADWLEFRALLSPDNNSSRGDLDSALRTASIQELDRDDTVEQKGLEVFAELQDRAQAGGHGYPFETADLGVLQLKPGGWHAFPTYVFCLCMSWRALKDTKRAPRLFQKVSCQAAANYLQGRALGFGSPRTELPRRFTAAVTEVCRLIGEGRGYQPQPSLSRKDDTLDLVAWKEFADEKPSKVMMFGQCGAGRNWTEKLGELQPDAFWRQWMLEGSVSPLPIKSFFTPYRVRRCLWDHCARQAGILFDRCRIAYWAHGCETLHQPMVEWTSDFLQRKMT
jgi:hypothetical protein